MATMDPSVTSTPVSLPLRYLDHYMEDSVVFESPPKFNLESSAHDQRTNEPVFCDGSNLPGCLMYLNQGLTTLGFSPLSHGESPDLDPIQVVNCVYDLLQQHHHHVKCREDLETSLHRAHSDVSLLKDTKARLQDKIEELGKEIGGLMEKERQAVKKVKSLSAKLRAEQDEMRRLKSSMQHKETQFSHEARKKEREYCRLKERLGQLVSDKSQERRLGMEILNALQRGDGKRAQWRLQRVGAKQDEELYRVIVANYEERQKELIAENGSLRESLVMMQKELISLLNEKSLNQTIDKDLSGDFEVEGTEGPNQEELLSSGHFQMPYELVRDGIERSLHSKWEKVKEQFDLMRTSRGTTEDEYKSEIEKLEKRLAEYEDLVDKNGVGGEGKGGTKNESWIAEQSEHLAMKKEYLGTREKHLEEREKKFLEAVSQLDRDREEFELKKINFLREQFLDTSVFSTSFLSTSSSLCKSNSTPMRKHFPRSSGVQSYLKSASPDLKVTENSESPQNSCRDSQLHTRNQAAGSKSSPALKRCHPVEIAAVPTPHIRDEASEEDLCMAHSIVLSPGKQQGRVLNECCSPVHSSDKIVESKHKSILQHSTEVRKALERHKGELP